MYKREVDLEGGGVGVALLDENCALGGSTSDELAMRRSSSTSPGKPLKPAACDCIAYGQHAPESLRSIHSMSEMALLDEGSVSSSI